jgi:rubrerythrin
MKVLKVEDILEFAVKIEENGEEFYRHAVEIADDGKIKELFEWLANEEIKHQKTFGEMLKNVEVNQAWESFPGEYQNYVNEFVANMIFSDEQMAEIKDEVNNALSAVKFAMNREKDAILYYQEMKRFVKEANHSTIEKVIDEERKHYAMLSAIKKDI